MTLTNQHSVVLTPVFSGRHSAVIKDYTNFKSGEEDDEDSHPYFGVGHGDFNEEFGYSPTFVVWAIVGGRLKVSELNDPEQEDFGGGETHGALWGHDVTDMDYKGRYEPETGSLTIVKPERFRHREVPGVIMQKLESKFKKISEIRLF
jgi:hypothetical protein